MQLAVCAVGVERKPFCHTGAISRASGMRISFLLFVFGAAGCPKLAETAVHAGRLLDVGTGKTQTDVYIVVRGKRIAAVERAAPAGATVIDLSNLTVLPGLCDCHAHVLYNPKDYSPTAVLTMSS